MRIVVFCPSAVGDVVMASPLFRALRTEHPQARIAGIVRPAGAATLGGNPWFDTLHVYDPKAKRGGFAALKLIGALRRERYDLGLILPNSFRSALLIRAGGVKRRIGYDRYGRGFLLTDRLEPPRDQTGSLVPAPIVPYYLELAKRIGIRESSSRLELFTTPEDDAAADQAFRELDFDQDRRLVVINTGGAYGPAKDWPIPHFVALCRRMAVEMNMNVLVICGPGERESARSIAAGARHPQVKSLAERRLSIGLSKACVRRADLLISTDSGPRHFAPPFRVPVLTLFGPTHIAWTRTNSSNSQHIYHPVHCGPCQRPICPLGHHHCMTNLSPDEVYNAARRMLGDDSPLRSRDREPAAARDLH